MEQSVRDVMTGRPSRSLGTPRWRTSPGCCATDVELGTCAAEPFGLASCSRDAPVSGLSSYRLRHGIRMWRIGACVGRFGVVWRSNTPDHQSVPRPVNLRLAVIWGSVAFSLASRSFRCRHVARGESTPNAEGRFSPKR
jgi:hypothetical protein